MMHIRAVRSVLGQVMPETTKAAMHRKLNEPGSANP